MSAETRLENRIFLGSSRLIPPCKPRKRFYELDNLATYYYQRQILFQVKYPVQGAGVSLNDA